MMTSLDFFAAIFVLLCVFSVIVRDFLSGSTLFWAIIASFAVILTSTVLKSEIFLLLACIFALLAKPVTIFAREKRLREKEHSSLRPLLSQIILNLKSGMSLRASLRKEKSAEMLCRMLEEQKFSHFEDTRWRNFAQLIMSLDRDPARVLPRLEGFRRRLHVEDKFLARVSQILAQPKLQAVVILVLYVGLVVFVMHSFSSADFKMFLFLSLVLVTVGVVRLWILGRTFRWKV